MIQGRESEAKKTQCDGEEENDKVRKKKKRGGRGRKLEADKVNECDTEEQEEINGIYNLFDII